MILAEDLDTAENTGIPERSTVNQLVAECRENSTSRNDAPTEVGRTRIILSGSPALMVDEGDWNIQVDAEWGAIPRVLKKAGADVSAWDAWWRPGT